MTDFKNPAQLRELMEKVTPGPWEVSEDTNEAWGRTDKELYIKPVFYGSYSKYDQASRYYEGPDLWDAQFIALSREALPYWITRAEAAESELAERRELQEAQSKALVREQKRAESAERKIKKLAERVMDVQCPPNANSACGVHHPDCLSCWIAWAMKAEGE